MSDCTNNWVPVISALAVQIPILVAVIANYLNLKISQAKQKAGHKVLAAKIDSLTTVTVNGLHNPTIVATDKPQNVDNSG